MLAVAVPKIVKITKIELVLKNLYTIKRPVTKQRGLVNKPPLFVSERIVRFLFGGTSNF